MIDSTALASLGPQIAERMVGLYLKSSSQILETICEAIENDDLGCARDATLALRVSSANIGVVQVAALAHGVEMKIGVVHNLSDSLDQLRCAHKEACGALEQTRA